MATLKVCFAGFRVVSCFSVSGLYKKMPFFSFKGMSGMFDSYVSVPICCSFLILNNCNIFPKCYFQKTYVAWSVILIALKFSDRPPYLAPSAAKRLIYILLLKKSLRISLLPVQQHVVSIGRQSQPSLSGSGTFRCAPSEREGISIVMV